MREKTFTEVAFLLMGGRLPDESERKLFDVLLVSCAEHGVGAPSAFVPRVSVSVGNPMNAAMAAGLLAIGDFHGGAVEACAELLQSSASAEKIVADAREAGERIPGFGHKVYKDKDPRAEALLAKAAELKLAGARVEKIRAMGEELEKQSGKHLPLNIDGAIAALMCEMKLDARLGKALFGFARMPAMMAHALEELQNEKPYRRFGDEDISYRGPSI